MSEPITLTERERAVFLSLADRLSNSTWPGAKSTGGEPAGREG